ncbi:MAG: Rieske 2Fe-2S family protein [Candidatus Aldehydirespiratoraceae bacterium]|jgi:Rieske 2Fe-2S family protein
MKFGVEINDRIPKERYYDPDFFQMEAELLWPRVWQMACRLEEIPNPHDVVEYEILDQSVIVCRTEDMGVRAFENACRHRGVKLVEGRSDCESGFVCPFHGWCYGADGTNVRVTQPRSFSAENLAPADINLRSVRCEIWGGCAWINFDDDAPPLRQSLEPAATILDHWKVDSLRAEWWTSIRLPVNWKLAQEAFVEQYHVIETHPQLVIPDRFKPRNGTFDPKTFIDGELKYLHTMSEGMAGMVHANDVAIAEQMRDITLSDDADEAMATWHQSFNDAVVKWHTDAGSDIPDLNDLEARGVNEPMGYCFPHYFVLPMYSSASSYRFRPLGPEETLMEIWSMTRFPEGEEPEPPTPPTPIECDDPALPPIPAQDFSNLPRQQQGLRTRAFEYMRLAKETEGHISNFHRTIDGYLDGRSHDELQSALAEVNVNPLERSIVDLGL